MNAGRSEMLAELLDLARQNVRATGVQEKTLHLVRLIYESVAREEAPSLAGLRRELLLRELAKEEPSTTPVRRSIYELLTMGSKADSSDETVPSPPNLRSEGEDPKE